MPAADVGQRLVAIQDRASRLGDVETCVGVAGCVLEGDGDASNGIDERLERAEVDLYVVVDGDAEVVGDGGDQLVRLVRAIRAVDPTSPVGTVDLHPQVARE